MKLDDKMWNISWVCILGAVVQFTLGFSLDLVILRASGLIFSVLGLIISIPGMMGVYIKHDMNKRSIIETRDQLNNLLKKE